MLSALLVARNQLRVCISVLGQAQHIGKNRTLPGTGKCTRCSSSVICMAVRHITARPRQEAQRSGGAGGQADGPVDHRTTLTAVDWNTRSMACIQNDFERTERLDE